MQPYGCRTDGTQTDVDHTAHNLNTIYLVGVLDLCIRDT